MRYLALISFVLLALGPIQAQDLFIFNGGRFGGTDFGNLRRYDFAQDRQELIDSFGTTSAQDLYFDEQEHSVFVAAGDSLFKFDLRQRQRLASVAFPAGSTIKLLRVGQELLVGNWYEPFGHSGGPFTRHLLIYDAQDLSLRDSLPFLAYGAKDFVYRDDTLYVAQNLNDFSTNFEDSLGYLAVVHLPSRQLIRRDTLASNGEDLGRLYLIGDTLLLGLNSKSNTLSYYSIPRGQVWTQPAGVNLQVPPYGQALVAYQGHYYLPYDDGIGRYDLLQGQAQAQGFIGRNPQASIAWDIDTVSGRLYLAEIFFANQANNLGKVYGLAQGDSLRTFSLGFGPEVLRVYYGEVWPVALGAVFGPKLALRAYPNPSIGPLRLSVEAAWTGAQPQRLMVYDVQGRFLFEKPWPSGQDALDLDFSLMPNAWYQLFVLDDKQSVLWSGSFNKRAY